MEPTLDPNVFIEERSEGYVRYRHTNGRRWEVHGTCNGNRACMVGAVINGIEVKTIEEAQALPAPELDCPVGPGFSGCCDLRIVELQ